MPTTDTHVRITGDSMASMALSSVAWNGSYATPDGTVSTYTGTWTISGLTPGTNYRVGVSLPGSGDTVRYRVYDGGYPSGTQVHSYGPVSQSPSLTPNYTLTDPGSRSVLFVKIYEGSFSSDTVAVYITNATVGGDGYLVIDAVDISEPPTGTEYTQDVSGGIQFGGNPTTGASYTQAVSGAILFGGDPTITMPFVQAVSGGLSFGGSPAISATYNPAITDGLALGGSPSISASYTEAVSGGLTFGGDVIVAFGLPVSGGISFGGDPAITMAYGQPITGGLTLGGSPTISTSWTIPISGGLRFGTPPPMAYRDITFTAVSVPIPRFPVVLRLPIPGNLTLSEISSSVTIPHRVRSTDGESTVVEFTIDLGTSPVVVRASYALEEE